ncbi:sigma-70 family RNA polymerase sigma factor [Nocardioides sp. WS12]|uniref:sigma-70 family RNA polymerase sigma factor n=1 Tax=Nocardioides sp. WS12 TaxID=2486272 RepID=UPI001F028138|nr:sigma-70 family RNA polymerase sigma factor [Nocardioides sp. WS12]
MLQRQELRHEAILLNLEVARSIAARYAGRGIPTDDLEQVACAALVRAAADFDPKLSNEFIAYAVPTIRGEVKKHFRDCGWTIRPPRRVQELQASVAHARALLQQSLGREPTLEEVADDIGADLDQVIEAAAADGCFTPTSLDRPVTQLSDLTIGDLLPASSSGFDAAEARVLLGPAIRHLPPRDRRILRLRFFEGRTQQEIGDELGVTQMQVSRLLTRILRDLRRALGPESLDALGA